MSIESIESGLRAYKHKFYKKKLLSGILISISSFGLLLLIINLLESAFWFNTNVRSVLFIFLTTSLILPLYFLVLIPILELLKIKRGVRNEDFASEIGTYFPEISDKLTNLLQLNSYDHKENRMIQAAINQKSKELKGFRFDQAVSLKDVHRYTGYFLALIGCYFLLGVINIEILSESTQRVLHFKTDYQRPAPFQFVVNEQSLKAFKNEDLLIDVSISGEVIPEVVTIRYKNRSIPLKKNNNSFNYLFRNLQEDLEFQFEASGFKSKNYTVEVWNRPEITSLQLQFDFPSYTKLQNTTSSNNGNARIPQGTRVTWKIQTQNTDSILLKTDKSILTQNSGNQDFSFKKQIFDNTSYEVVLANLHGTNASTIKYELSVIEDQYPKLEAYFYPDSTSFKSILISGIISDDYGYTSLRLDYKTKEVLSSKSIPINQTLKQSFLYDFQFNDIELDDNSIECWLTLFDNDAINGPKKTTSTHFFLKRPSQSDLKKLMEDLTNTTEKDWISSRQQSKELNERLKELEERLKNQNNIGWQEEKLINELISKKNRLNEEVDQLKADHQKLNESQKEIFESEKKLSEKSEALQKMLEELMDEETKKLFAELQKLMEEKSDTKSIQDKVSQLKNKEKNFEKELERTLELFKRLKLETSISKASEELDKLGNKQMDLAEQPEDKKSLEQQEINQTFESIEEDLKEISNLNQELKRPEALEDFDSFSEEIKESLENIKQDLTNSDFGKAGQKQKNAGNKMKAMASKMNQMQSALEMEAMQENMEQLQDILDNLIKLSFEQERIFQGLRDVDQVDPRYLIFAQNQLSLIENIKVIEDSLLALGSRVIQITSFVSREVGEVQENLKMALSELKERQKSQAVTHEQYAMTSMNNLALLLDNTLQQMQMSMSEAMGSPKSGESGKPKPQMSELQQQLGDRIEKLRREGTKGRELSEQLAELAAEQEEIRQHLEDLEKKNNGQNPNGDKNGSSTLKDIIKKMEQNEVDLVNKRLTQTLIDRQKEIVTRMLQAEESMREQEEKPERESKSANQFERKIPKSYEDYLNKRKSEIELLNTIPLELNPFYKKEVNDYFRRLSTFDN